MERNQADRFSNFEILRIIAMTLIVASHYVIYGGFELTSRLPFGNLVFLQIFSLGGRLGTNLFLLIAGYFLIRKKNFESRKLVRLLLDTLFYSVSIAFIFTATGLAPFNTISIIKSLMPISSGLYWFIGAYCLILLILPFLNTLLCSISKDNYRKLLFVLFFVWIVIGSIALGGQPFGYTVQGWSIYIYALGGYISLYPEDFDKIKEKVPAILLIVVFLICSIVVALDGINMILGKSFSIDFIGKENFILIFLCSVFLFLLVRNWKIISNKGINYFAASILSVYLIHENGLYFRSYLWTKLLNGGYYQMQVWIIPYSLLVIVGVVISCVIIDKIRIFVFGKIEERIIILVVRLIEKLKTLFLNSNHNVSFHKIRSKSRNGGYC